MKRTQQRVALQITMNITKQSQSQSFSFYDYVLSVDFTKKQIKKSIIVVGIKHIANN